MNRRLENLWASLFGAFLVAVACTGCRREPSTAEQAVAHATPEQGFEEIVRVFKDGIESPGGSASGFVAQNTGASSRFQVSNTVTSQLIKPAKPDDPYRGTITVTSQSIYSIRMAPDDDEKKDDDKNASANNRQNPLDTTDTTNSGFESFDKGLVSQPPSDDKSSGSDAPIVQRRPDKVGHTYDLVYQGNSWKLVTKLDPKTEASIENAFERALRLQP